jgi:Flp pilus assembly protein TadG
MRVRRGRGERGAGGVEFLVAVVAILFLFTTLVQYGIRMHANRIAEAAAREGAATAARFDGTTGAGRTAANKYVTTSGAVAIRGSTVSTARSPTEARVTVTVQIVTLMPFLDDPITSTAVAPVERFVE